MVCARDRHRFRRAVSPWNDICSGKNLQMSIFECIFVPISRPVCSVLEHLKETPWENENQKKLTMTKESKLQKRLEQLAYEYKKTELWETLADSDVFGVELEDGRIAYCCVMGRSGVHIGVGVFVGDRGFRTYLDSMEICQVNNDRVLFEHVANSENIHLTFSDEGGVDFRCQHPHLVAEPNNYTDAERIVMGQVLEAAIALNQFITVAGGDVVSLGFEEYEEYPTKEGGKEAPLLTRQAIGYTCTTIKLPAYDKSDEQRMEDLAENALKTENVRYKMWSLKGLRKISTLQCRLIHSPSAVKEEDSTCAFFPHMLLAVNKSDGSVLKPELARLEDEDGAQTIFINFLNSIGEAGRLPLQISVPDERTECFLKTFCRHMGIKLVRERKPLKELNKMWEFLFRYSLSADAYEDEDDDFIQQRPRK